MALVAAMVREVESMAARPGAGRQARIWRARLHHRLLRLLRRSPQAPDAAIATGLAILAAGRAILEIEAALGDAGLSDSTRRRLHLARARLVTLGQAPERAAAALEAAARSGGRGAAVLSAAATAIRESAATLAASASGPRPERPRR